MERKRQERRIKIMLLITLLIWSMLTPTTFHFAYAEQGQLPGNMNDREAGQHEQSKEEINQSEGLLNPDFDSDTEQYTVRVSENIESHSTTAFTEYKMASVTVNGQSVNSGEASPTIKLLAGVETHLSASSASDFETNAVENGVEIVNYTGPGGELNIPDILDGQAVVGIGNLAFYQKGLTNVHIPEGVVEIGNTAFEGNELTSITIPDSVERIENYAFSSNLLTEVELSANVAEIGSATFSRNPIETVTVAHENDTYKDIDGKGVYTDEAGEKVLVIGTSSGEIAPGTNVIGEHALSGRGATSTTIVDSVTTIENRAFQYNRLTELEIPDTVTTIDSFAFQDNELREVSLGSGVKVIDPGAFENNQLTELVIPDQVESLGNFAFADNQLEKVHLGANVQFYSSRSGSSLSFNPLVEITVDNSNSHYEDADGMGLYFRGESRLVVGTTSGAIKSETTHIGTNAFYGRGIQDIAFPDNLQGIGNNAFTHNQLRQVDIPDKVRSIGRDAFTDNYIETVKLGENLQTLDNTAFISNPIQTIVIHDDNSHYKDIGGTGLYSLNGDTLVVGTSNAHIEPGTVTIGTQAFRGRGLDSLFIPDSVQTIEQSAFNSNHLENIILLGYLTTIERDAFFNNQSDPADLTIYGYKGSAVETHATTNGYNFVALDSSPVVDITFNGVPVDELLSEDGVLSVDYGFEGVLNAVYSHELEDVIVDIVDLENISWTIEGDSNPIKGNTLELKSYTDIVGERTVTLTVETNYGGKDTKEITLDIGPPVPSEPDLTMDEITETSITLSWDPVAYADEYILKRDGDEVYKSSSTSHTDTGLDPDTSYDYSLVAVNDSGKSDETIQTAKTNLPIPATPALSIEGMTETRISLSWDEVDYADEYLLLRDEDEVYRGSDLIFEDTYLNPNTEYSYTLVAINDSGTSEKSVITATTVLPIPNTPNLQIDGTSMTSIALTWNSVQYADEYILQRDGDEIFQGTSTSFTDEDLTADTVYRYTLVAINNSGESDASTQTVKTNLPIPETSILSIAGTAETSISLSWGKVDYAEEYILKRDGDEVYRGTEVEFNDTGLTPNTSYHYSLVAVNPSGTNEESTLTSQTSLPVPSHIELELDSASETSTSITLIWNAARYADEYLLLRDKDEVYRGADLMFEDTDLNPNTEFSYTLVAINASGTSEESVITATTALPIPETPTLSIAETTETNISLSWAEVDYAEEYILKRDGDEVYRGTELKFNDTGLTPNTSYHYSLVTVNNNGTSEQSKITITTDLLEPQPEEFEVNLDTGPNEETEEPVTMKVSTTSEADITSLKWLVGDRTEDEFAEAGNEIDLETMAFTVEENGTYTIFALNAEGVAALSTIEVSNIVDPEPEPQPEEFEINLDTNPGKETRGPVTMKVSTTSEADITSLKWLAGDRTEDDFAEAGNEIDLETMAFTVEENGTYTIFALNAEGVAALSTITISNIVNPSDGTDPGNGTGPGEGTDSGDNGQTLPSTATNLFNLLIIGGAMLVLGFTFMVFRRKQNA